MSGNFGSLIARIETCLRAMPNGCVMWTGKLNNNGYGLVSVKGKWRLSHRVIYSLRNGPIPAGKVIMHKCDTPACCNTDHLKIGVQKDNVRDAIKKRRMTHIGRLHRGKPECLRGHPFSKENTVFYRGGRICRECRRKRMREWARKSRAKNKILNTTLVD